MVRMASAKEELDKKVNACIKASGTDKVLRNLDWSNPTDWDDKDLSSATEAFGELKRCIFDSIRTIDKDKFINWMDQEAQPFRVELDKAGRRLIRYWSRMSDPFELVVSLSIIVQILQGFWSAPDDKVTWDPDIAPKLLMILQLHLLRSIVEKAQLRPLLDVLSLANSTLGLDANWCTSAVALVLEELLIRRKLHENDVQLKDRENYHDLCKKLVSVIEKSETEPGLDILLSKGHREVRNNILHKGWKPTDEDTERVVAHVFRFSRDLRLDTD
jgi:hypothetical protein